MRLKSIEPGTVIRCKTEEEVELLKTHYNLPEIFAGYWNVYKENTCYNYCGDIHWAYSELSYYKTKNIRVIEFSDLIIPELSAKEVLEIISEIHTMHYITSNISSCKGCPLENITDHCAPNMLSRNAKAIIEVCEQWKADHSQKEPEVEWVFDCFQNSNIENAPDPIITKTEEEAKKYCEEMAKKYPGEAFAYIPVCRVKQ